MLCHLCEPFLNDLLAEDFVSWRHVKPGWYTYKHGDYATVSAAAEAGCEMCALFNTVRRKAVPGIKEVSQKWLGQQCSIDYKYDHDRQELRSKGVDQVSEDRARWTFYLYTVLPSMSCLAFEISHPDLPTDAEDVGPTKQHPWPYATSSSAISEVAVRTACSWLNQCANFHSHCKRQVRAPLPTRVLEIKRFGDSLDIRLQVNNGQQGQYVTLSHCWGDGSPLKLLKRNVSSFRNAIPVDELPLTFQDAVRLTAALGQRYIWIDALCILQDDQDDWRREAASMCSVFENASFSISALNATDCHSGLLSVRDTTQTDIDVAGFRIGIRERLPSLQETLQQSKLETRAWCLQERLLAQRILHVGPSQLYWECRTHVISETAPCQPLKNDSGQASRPFTMATKSLAGSEDHDHQKHWLTLVAGYSGRNLTKPSDRLPAIAGLAEKAKTQLGLGTYKQGLWMNNMLAGVLWRRDVIGKKATIPRSESVLTYGPSWSWASSMDAISYPLLDFKHKPAKADLTLKTHLTGTRTDVDSLASEPLSAAGQIKRGSCKAVSNPSALNEAVFKSSGSLLVDGGLTCFFDDMDQPVAKGCYCLFVSVFEQAQQPKSNTQREQRSAYLILERTQDIRFTQYATQDVFGSFRRIGMGFDAPAAVEKVFANAEQHRLELV